MIASDVTLEGLSRARDIFSGLCGQDDWRTRFAEDAVRQAETDAKLDAAGRGRIAQMVHLHLRAAEGVRSGRFQDALEDENRALAICEETVGKDDSRHWMFLQGLAMIHRRLCEYGRAKELYAKALIESDRHGGHNSMNHALIRGELATLFVEIGALELAAPQFAHANERWRAWASDEFVSANPGGPLYGVQHRAYSVFLNNRGLFCSAIGDHDTARTFYRESASVARKLNLRREYMLSLINLGAAYSASGDFQPARTTYEECARIADSLKDLQSYKTVCLSRLALAYFNSGESDRGSRLLRDVETLLSKPLPGASPALLGECYLGLALGHRLTGNRAKAKDLYLKAKATIGVKAGVRQAESRDSNYHASLIGLAWIHEAEGDLKAAKSLLEEAVVGAHNLLRNVPRAMSVRQRFALLRRQRFTLDRYFTVAIESRVSPDELYAHVLRWKGLIAGSLREDPASRRDPNLQALTDELGAVRGRLSRLWIPSQPITIDDQPDDLKRLTIREDELVALIAAKSRNRQTGRDARGVGAADLASVLRPRAALIDFFAYSHQRQSVSERRVLAFVVRPGHELAMIALGGEDPLAEAVGSCRNAIFRGGTETLKAASTLLVKKVWEPLQQHLEGTNELIVCPDGPFIFFPLGALPAGRGDGYLIEELPINYVTSARSLLEPEAPATEPRGFLAIGGIDYGTPLPYREQTKEDPRLQLSGTQKAGRKSEVRFAPLQGTLDEASRAVQLFRQTYSDRKRADLWTGGEPTERRVKSDLADSSSRPWDYILFSSHGIFSLPGWAGGALDPENWGPTGPSDKAYAVRLGGMYFSGIVLAGANRREGDGEDGILTADEVHGLDLSDVALVVLTGCETGLGVPISGEGLQGLRSAFHAAGARSVMASLWEVDDEATRTLIEQFYANLWAGGMTPQDALRHAQLRLLRTRPPYFWSGFVLSGVSSRPPALLHEVSEPIPQPGELAPHFRSTRGSGYGRVVPLIVVASLVAIAGAWRLKTALKSMRQNI